MNLLLSHTERYGLSQVTSVWCAEGDERMHLRKWITILIIVLIAIGLPFTYHRALIPSSHSVLEYPLSFAKIKTVELNTISADIFVKLSNTSDGGLILSTRPEFQRNLSVVRKGGLLKLVFKNRGHNNNDSSYMEVFISNTVTALKVNAVTGDFNIKDTTLDNLSIETTSGDINLSQVVAAQSVLTSISGDVFWKGSIISALISTVSGDVTLELGTTFVGKINASSTSGDVFIPTNIPSGPHQISIKTVSGDIQVL